MAARLTWWRRSASAFVGECRGRASTSRCSTRPVLRISTISSRLGLRATASTWRTVLRRESGVLDDGDLAGQGRQQPHRAVHDVVEVDGAVEQGRDRPALGRGHRLDGGEPVDEEPVALVGRHPARAGVGLGDESLLLQRGHVVAHRRRGDPEAGAARPASWSRRAPRWRRSPRRSPGARRAFARPARSPPPPGSSVALTSAECQCY